LGVERAAEGVSGYQQNLFEEIEPEWVEINVKGVRVEKVRDFGGPWLGFELMRYLGLDRFFLDHVSLGREDVGWVLS
jgi:hypothetical protein